MSLNDRLHSLCDSTWSLEQKEHSDILGQFFESDKKIIDFMPCAFSTAVVGNQVKCHNQIWVAFFIYGRDRFQRSPSALLKLIITFFKCIQIERINSPDMLSSFPHEKCLRECLKPLYSFPMQLHRRDETGNTYLPRCQIRLLRAEKNKASLFSCHNYETYETCQV